MSKENNNTVIFDDWKEVVDCNECQHYYNDTCDGVPKGTKRNCQSFLATRSVVIPNQIKELKRANKRLWWAMFFLALANVFEIIGDLL